ncbi:MAG: hypothetical protein C0506_07185 [Anaerolinea sp.]|nr:hypothetical protein [Anaerolinea sp.]
MQRRRLIAVVALFGLGAMLFAASGAAQQPPELTNRAFLPLVAREDLPTPEPTPGPARPVPPPPGPGYCGPTPNGPPFPANTIFGLFTIGGEPAPANTLITLTFDGLPGPSAYTLAAGGFRIDWAAGGGGQEPRCINEVGSMMGILVSGVHTSFEVAVGQSGLAYRFDLALP